MIPEQINMGVLPGALGGKAFLPGLLANPPTINKRSMKINGENLSA